MPRPSCPAWQTAGPTAYAGRGTGLTGAGWQRHPPQPPRSRHCLAPSPAMLPLQNRSADEPATTYFRCTRCAKVWQEA